MGRRGAMRRSLVGVLAALLLVPVVGAGVAAAGAPVAPKYADATSVSWEQGADEWGTYCVLTVNAVLDRPMASGERVFAHVWLHTRFVDFDGYENPWYEATIVAGRLGHGTQAFSGTFPFYVTKYGHNEVDTVTFQLHYRSGEVIDQVVMPVAYRC